MSLKSLYYSLLHRYYQRQARIQAAKEVSELHRAMDRFNPKLGLDWKKMLTDREVYVTINSLSGFSIDETAKQMNVTQERIRQIQAKALRKLQKANER